MISKFTKEQVEQLVSSSSIEEFNNTLKQHGIQLSDDDLKAIDGGFADWLGDLADRFNIPKERIAIHERFVGANAATVSENIQAIASGRPKDIVWLSDNTDIKNKQ